MGVAAEIMVAEDEVPHRVRVVAAEPIAPVVSTASELRLSRLGIDAAGVRLDPKIATADVDRLAGFRRTDCSTAVPVGTVDPVVQAPGKPVDPVLLVAFDESLKQHLAPIGPAVTVSVLGIENLGGGRDQDAFAPGDDPVWEVQLV